METKRTCTSLEGSMLRTDIFSEEKANWSGEFPGEVSRFFFSSCRGKLQGALGFVRGLTVTWHSRSRMHQEVREWNWNPSKSWSSYGLSENGVGTNPPKNAGQVMASWVSCQYQERNGAAQTSRGSARLPQGLRVCRWRCHFQRRLGGFSSSLGDMALVG